MNVHYKHIMRFKKLKNLAKSTGTCYSSGAYYDETDGRYKRVFCAKRKKSFKSFVKHKSQKSVRLANKKICLNAIRTEDETYTSNKNNNYKRCYDADSALY